MKTKSLLFAILLTLFSVPAWAFDVTFVWDAAPAGVTVTGWKLYQKDADGNVTPHTILAAGGLGVPSKTIDVIGGPWFFTLTAYNSAGESLPTSPIKIDLRVPSTPTGFKFAPLRLN